MNDAPLRYFLPSEHAREQRLQQAVPDSEDRNVFVTRQLYFLRASKIAATRSALIFGREERCGTASWSRAQPARPSLSQTSAAAPARPALSPSMAATISQCRETAAWRMRETPPRCLRMQEIEGLRDAAAHDDRLRAVEMRKIAEADAEPGRLALEQRQREAVAGARRFDDVARGDGVSADVPRQQARRLCRHGLAAGACQRAARGQRLEAAMRTAGTDAARPAR